MAVEKPLADAELEDEEYGLIPIRELTYDEAFAMLDTRARERLNMSGEEFLRRWREDDFSEAFMDENHSDFFGLHMIASVFGR